MHDFSYSLHYYVHLILVICAPIIGIIFWIKQRTKESLLFALGILLLPLGELIMIFTNLWVMLMDNPEKMHELPLTWYIGHEVSSIGIIVTVVGFALVTWKMKKTT